VRSPSEAGLAGAIRQSADSRLRFADVAHRIVLDGFELGTDAKVIRYPDRYMDDRGTVMWDRVMKLIGGVQHV
jgi:hypothetical protein